ncbi:MAG: hypothetical protein GY705_08375 [Bacteroidetes bacterium]|nr:hypothetical protein [Bacteroidota bacterium]
MEINDQNRQTWLDLYRAAVAFRDLKAWEWMYDSELFGVKDPETGEIGYCCIMGNLGEVFGMAVYMGDEGLDSYWNLAGTDEENARIVALSQKCLIVTFENREDLSDKDRKHIKELGLKFRGKKNWVNVREHLPGFYPWYISDAQAKYLALVLGQAVIVAKRAKESTDFFHTEDYFVRVSENTENGLKWKDTYIDEPVFDEEVPAANPFLSRKAKQELERREKTLLFSLDFLPSAVTGEGSDRPFFPVLAIWVDYKSQFILGQEMVMLSELETTMERRFYDMLFKMEYIPQKVLVTNELTFDLVAPIVEELGVQLIYAPDDPVNMDIMMTLSRFMR